MIIFFFYFTYKIDSNFEKKNWFGFYLRILNILFKKYGYFSIYK